MKTDKCRSCINSRQIVSENGFKSVCGLSDKKAMQCLIGEKDFFVDIKELKKEKEE